MKKVLSVLLVFCLVFGLSISAFASDTTKNENSISIVMVLNKETAIVNGTELSITAPVLAFNKTYVDLYCVAPLMGVSVQWVEDYIGYFKAIANDKSLDFKLIYQCSDLINQNYKFFVKDSKIFVSLRELCELTEYNISYSNGIITVGNNCDFTEEVFSNINPYNSDEYVKTAYPARNEYVIYPYQKYSYETMMANAKQLEHMYPEIIKTSSIGNSVEGRDLLLIEFGKGQNKVFVCGTHHAREYISTTYLMYAIDRYAYAYRNGYMWGKYSPKDILDNITFCIVPMVNPDGVNLVQNGINATKNPDEIAAMGIYEGSRYGYRAWKANVHGVDLNWNYDKDWSLEKNKNERGSSGFNGDSPNTEPETIAVSKYVDNNVFDAYMSFHTQGEVFYWAENDENPTYINKAIKRDTGFDEYIESATGVGGSFFDYVYRKYNKPTITVELCPYVGNYPYPDKKFDTVWTPAKNVLLIVGNEILYNKLMKN